MNAGFKKMKLIILYDPPAVGKLTVAKTLVDSTGYKLFHNHLTVDPVISIFPRGTKSSVNMVRQIRYMMLAGAARVG